MNKSKENNKKIQKKVNTKKRFTNFIKRWVLLLSLATSLVYIIYSVLYGLYYFSKYNPNRYIVLLAVLGIVFILNDYIADKKKGRV